MLQHHDPSGLLVFVISCRLSPVVACRLNPQDTRRLGTRAAEAPLRFSALRLRVIPERGILAEISSCREK